MPRESYTTFTQINLLSISNADEHVSQAHMPWTLLIRDTM